MRKVISRYTGVTLGYTDLSDWHIQRKGFRSDIGMYYSYGDIYITD